MSFATTSRGHGLSWEAFSHARIAHTKTTIMCINKFHLSIYIYSLPNTRWVTRGFILYYTSHTGVQSDVLPVSAIFYLDRE